MLQTHHLKNDHLDAICEKVTSWPVTVETERFLNAVSGGVSPNDRAVARLCLAELYHREVDGRRTTEAARQGYLSAAERLLEEVIAKYGDVKSRTHHRAKLGTVAQSRLYELRNLKVGTVAPEIGGTDLAGKTFKLSSFRGKVVVLDFWHMY